MAEKTGDLIRILIIDDSATSRRLLRTYAEGSEFPIEVEEAATSELGLQYLRNNKVDLVFLDYVLPDIDGLQTLRRIRHEIGDVMVVVLTGQGSEPLAVAMMKTGADDYIPKSDLSPDCICRAIRQVNHLRRVRKSHVQENCDCLDEQSDFFTRMSHEIRTPLNVILGTTELLQSSELDAEQKHLVHTCQRAGRMLMVQINDILDLAKTKKGELELKKIPFELKETILSTGDMMAVQAKGKALGFDCQIGEDVAEIVLGDADRLTQILVNLVGNAIKFTNRGSVCVVVEHVSESENPGDTRITIKDTGIGIPEHKLQDIFTSYNQGGSHVSMEFGGTGLGLEITKKLVEKMGGEISVTSEVGAGSTFMITIPYTLPNSRKVDETSPGFRVKASLPSDEDLMPDTTVSESTAALPPRILVAEDTYDNRLLVKSFLRNLPITIDFAINGRDAVEKQNQNDYAMILMDMEMPEMNGFDATAAIRLQEQNQAAGSRAKIPIIALTAHSFSDEKDRCMGAGCTDFVMKPFKRQALVDIVNRYIPALADSVQ